MDYQPKPYFGSMPLVDSNLVLVDNHALPNNTSYTGSWKAVPKRTAGKFKVVVWCDAAAGFTIAQAKDLTIEVLRNSAATGDGVTLAQFHKATYPGFQSAGAAVVQGLVIAKSGRDTDLTYQAGDVLYSHILDDNSLAPDYARTDYGYVTVKFTSTVDLSALKVSAAIVPVL